MNRKILYVILDGLGDRPIASLGGRTPLDAAGTPNLDRLAAAGEQGLVTTVGEGIAPESDVAVMAILGYDPRIYHAGRGPLEALGAGLTFATGDLALRGNFATGGDGAAIFDRRVGRNLTTFGFLIIYDGLSNELKELWPDIRRKVFHKNTP